MTPEEIENLSPILTTGIMTRALPSLPPEHQAEAEDVLRKQIEQLLSKGIQADAIIAAYTGGSPVPEIGWGDVTSALSEKRNLRQFKDHTAAAYTKLTALDAAREVMDGILPDLPEAHHQVMTKDLSSKFEQLLRLEVPQERIPDAYFSARKKVGDLPGVDINAPLSAPEAFSVIDGVASQDLWAEAKRRIAAREAKLPQHDNSEKEERARHAKAAREEKAWDQAIKITTTQAENKGWGAGMSIARKYEETQTLADNLADKIEAKDKALARSPKPEHAPSASEARSNEAQARAKLARSGPAVFTKKIPRLGITGFFYNSWNNGVNGYRNAARSGSYVFNRYGITNKIIKTANQENARARQEVDQAVYDRHLAEDAQKRVDKGGNVSVEEKVDEVFANALKADGHNSQARREALTPLLQAYAKDMSAFTADEHANREQVAEGYRNKLIALNKGETVRLDGHSIKMQAGMLSGVKEFQEPMDYLRATRVPGVQLNDVPQDYADKSKVEVIGMEALDSRARAGAAAVGSALNQYSGTSQLSGASIPNQPPANAYSPRTHRP